MTSAENISIPILARVGHVVLDFFGARGAMWRERAEEKEAGKEEDEVENDDRMTNPEESDEGRWLAVGDAEERIYIDRGGKRGSPSESVLPQSPSCPTQEP
jgi:hypothetical protein